METRSKRNINPDTLADLFGDIKLTPAKTKTKKKREEKDISDLFGNLTLTKTIGKTRRRRGLGFTHKKTHKRVGMETNGGRKRGSSKKRLFSKR